MSGGISRDAKTTAKTTAKTQSPAFMGKYQNRISESHIPIPYPHTLFTALMQILEESRHESY